jgi:hypothetical protein
METLLTYRGRAVRDSDVAFIRGLIAEHATASRRELSRELCAAWGWVQANGAPRDMVCRGLMLALHRAGHIELPAVRMRPPNPLAHRTRPTAVAVNQSPISGELSALGSLELYQVRRTPQERLFNSLLEEHHYLGYTQPVGEHLKYLVYAGERPVACLSWSSAPRHLGPRDRYIGWPAAARRANVHLLAYNSRFLILPWVQVKHLASHILGRMARMLATEWERVYGHPVYYLETFIDPRRFTGTCYRAANWAMLGPTTGRGHNAKTHRVTQPVKLVLGYPLTKHFRKLLSHEGAQ